ncbi:MAG TPA: threonine synthase [Candidatus Paceibacterota bacterium]
MKLVSTRDREKNTFSYTDVLLAGLAPDGGLYIPQECPKVSLDEISALKDASYADIALVVKRALVDGAIPDAKLKQFIDAAYAPEVFDMENGSVTPVREIGESLYLQNLSLGPTASFKDMAMQLLGREMEHVLEAKGKNLFILGATSGDTGSAAEAAVKGLSRIGLCMLSPEEGMSAFQKAQMGALSGDNIYNVSIRGRFDDCQDLVKAIKGNPEFADLGAVNSINWGRIAAQTAYYFAGYLQVAKKIGDPIDVAIPSGNFGNAFSAYVAKRMGLPIRRIIIATNENNVLDRLFKTGVYETRTATVTSSPSMDISKASNYERLFFDVCDQNAEKTRQYMETFNTTGRVDMKDFGLDKSAFVERGFVSGTSTHADRIAAIRQVYEESKTIIDPHTADGVYIAQQLKTDLPVICMATALPVKFEQTIQEALGFAPERPTRFKDLEKKESGGFTTMDADVGGLKDFIRPLL